MKKKYVKPVLVYEEFELSQHIADCAFTLNSDDGTNCTAVGDDDKGLGSWIMFSGDTCNVVPGALGEYCEFSGAPNVNVFKS